MSHNHTADELERLAKDLQRQALDIAIRLRAAAKALRNVEPKAVLARAKDLGGAKQTAPNKPIKSAAPAKAKRVARRAAKKKAVARKAARKTARRTNGRAR